MTKSKTNFEDKIIAVEWLDANQHVMRIENYNNLKSNDSGNDLLYINTTYGKIGKILKDVIIIVHEECNNTSDIDVTIIPRGWIISPKELSN